MMCVLPAAGMAIGAKDLVITDVWTENGGVYYQIRNLGDEIVPAGHGTALWLDGMPSGKDTIDVNMRPGGRLRRSFPHLGWQCSPLDDKVDVVADVDNIIKESDESNNVRTEFWYCDTAAPVILDGPTVSDITTTSARIRWATDEDCDSEVFYSRFARQWEQSQSHPSMSKDHDIVLSGLAPGTTYHFYVRSTDESTNTLTSAVHYFTTLPGSAGGDLSIAVLAAAGDKLPLEFFGESKDNDEVDRMEFIIDGQLAETDYSAPFRCMLDPVDLGMTVAQYAAGPSIMARARSLAGLMANQTIYMDISDWICFPVEFDFQSPRDDDEIILTSGSTVPPGTLLRFSVFASETQWEERETRWGTFVSGTDVECIEVYLDDDPVPILTETETQSLNEDWDAGGLGVGVHQFKVKAYAHDCALAATRTHTMTVREYEPRLEIVHRRVIASAEGNSFTVRIRLRNLYMGTVTLDGLHDNLVGFQVIEESRPDYEVEPNYRWNGKDTNLYIRFRDGVTLNFMQEIDVEYTVVPVLYMGFEDYRVGADPMSVVFDDPAGRLAIEEALLTREGLTFREEVRDACAVVDYLLVTNPRSLFGIYGQDDVNRLLSKMAELAVLRQGVLGYINTFTTIPATFGATDKLAVGDVLPYDVHAGGEIVMLEKEDDKVKIYGGDKHLKSFTFEDCHANDRVAVGEFWDLSDPGGFPIIEDEIAVVDGYDANEGEVYVYQYRPDSNDFTRKAFFSSSFNSGDGFAEGNIAVSGSNDSEMEILVANHENGQVHVYDRSGATWSWVRTFYTGFGAGDEFAVGDVVVGGMGDEVVIADIDDDLIHIYTADGDHYSFTWELHPGDQIRVADAGSGSWGEIIIFEVDRDRIRQVACSTVDGVFSHSLVVSWDYSLHENDDFAAGDFFRIGDDEIVVGHGAAGGGHAEADMDVLSGVGDSALSRYILDDLLDEGGDWADMLDPDWATNGYLLIVGENQIVPAFSRQFHLRYSDPFIRTTDAYYAATDDDIYYPDLAVGRIIGNTISQLIRPIQASIDVATGVCTLRNAFGAVASGAATGASGTSDEIDFVPERQGIADRLEDRGVTVVEMHEPTVEHFFDMVNYRDFIHMAGHGSAGSWDVIEWSHVDDRFDSGTTRPLVYGSSCNTGKYFTGYCLAESFLNHGAGAYVGATNVGYSPYHKWLATRFYDRLEDGSTLGVSLKNAKRNLIGAGDYDYERDYCGYNATVFHYFGDPKLDVDWTAKRNTTIGGEAKARQPLEFQGPLAELNVTVPDYTVTRSDGVDYVTIPGGGAYMEPDHYLVPSYTVWVHYGAEERVHSVELSEQSQPLADDNLILPVVDEREPGGVGRSAAKAPAGDEWWPRRDFDWTVVDEPGGKSTLVITIYPFFYNGNTLEAIFHKEYKFTVSSHTPTAKIRRLSPERQAWDLGDTVRVEMFLKTDDQGEGKDILAEAVILDTGTVPVAGLPLRTLYALRGLGSCAFDWDTTGAEPGDYRLVVTLRDTAGNELDKHSCAFSVGSIRGVISKFTATPACFLEGDLVMFSAGFTNEGDAAVTGTLVVEVQHESGVPMVERRVDFADLAPGATAKLLDTWTAWVNRPECHLVAYALYEGKATDLVILSPQPTGDLNLDGRVSLLDLVVLLNFLNGGPVPGGEVFTACEPTADLNADKEVDIADAVALAYYLVGN
ncbi:MAG: hypothetical protein JXQ27_12760 [Acidobacteria bacterium]|nr:hypothetical protein [Acidobacteriota bacterium]